LADYRKGTLILFLVMAPTKRGAPNITHINELEDFLIQIALAANPDLLNIKGTQMEEWGNRWRLARWSRQARERCN